MKKGLRARLGPALLTLVSLAVAAAGAELFLRVVAPQTLPIWVQSPDGVALLQSNRRVRLPAYEHVIESNELGHRDVSHASDDASAERIIVLGDSFAEAMTVPLDQMFARQLEAQLSDAGTPTVVVNAGISGWGTDDQLRYFEAQGPTLRPDIVICLFTIYNDVTDNLEREFHVSTPEGLQPRTDADLTGWPYRAHRMKAFVASRFHLVQLIRMGTNPRDYNAEGLALERHWVDLVRKVPPPSLLEGWTLTFDLLDALADSSRALGAEMVLVAVPMEFQVDPDALADFLQHERAAIGDFDLDNPQRKLVEWGQRKNVGVLDLRDRFASVTTPSRRLYLKEDGHWNRDGHAVAASAVSEWLRHEGLSAHRSLGRP